MEFDTIMQWRQRQTTPSIRRKEIEKNVRKKLDFSGETFL